ncbi:hypothetical protein FCM35_KLT01871 [Carex littledalei]|uniref:Neprosin PEP catalytic domain-containing protein n=1 Tax=Carex littledalei TaxID=544730 RepID=A0A833VRY1_9POAL|nr:hypothetical protein FCM35_KLT01871 [Carex littledalei]
MNHNSSYEVSLLIGNLDGDRISLVKAGLHHGTTTKASYKCYMCGWWQNGFLEDLDNKATHIQWLAYVTYQNNDTGPTMGSGHYPIEGNHKAAYMMNLKLFNKAGGYDSPKIDDLVQDHDRDICYRALPAVALHGETDKHKFYYGGPAGCRV